MGERPGADSCDNLCIVLDEIGGPDGEFSAEQVRAMVEAIPHGAGTKEKEMTDENFAQLCDLIRQIQKHESEAETNKEEKYDDGSSTTQSYGGDREP